MTPRTISPSRPFSSGVWQELLRHAFALVDEFTRQGGVQNPVWTFGGGTVFMLWHYHRMSKATRFLQSL